MNLIEIYNNISYLNPLSNKLNFLYTSFYPIRSLLKNKLFKDYTLRIKYKYKLNLPRFNSFKTEIRKYEKKMKNKKLSYIISFFILVILVSSPLLTVWFFENRIQYKNELVSKEQNLKTSESWILTNQILIDDSDPSINWSKTANDNDWCSGSGTWNDPYMLKNIRINISHPSHPCIDVRNSKVYFGIWNCSLFSKGERGIVLINVNNSNIYNNSILEQEIFGEGIFLSYSNNNSIDNNFISVYPGEGIFLSYSNNNSIDNNFIWDSRTGIRILNGSRNWMTSNLIKDCYHHGITIEGSNSHDCFIFNNILINNFPGVYLFGKAHELSHNTFKGAGIIIGYYREEVISYNIDTSNTLNNKPIYYYANKTNLSSQNFINAGQILLANCNNSKVADLNFSNTGLPILMVYCSNNEISNMSIMNEIYGMGLFECEDNTIKNNEIKHCGMGIWMLGNCNNNEFIENRIINTTHYGIILSGDDNNVFSYNLFKDNQMYGLRLSEYSDGNLIYKNIFLNNSDHAYDESVTNYWDNGILGNYWDDYNGIDLNFDGIGDTPYNISGTTGNQDNFPLIYPPYPEISIMKPSENTIFGATSPEFEISLQGFNIVSIWYTIDNGAHNYTITELVGTINSTGWNSASVGPVIIRFYAKDSAGKIGTDYVIVRKDTIKPAITINFPQINQEFDNSPHFNLSIQEPNIDTIWYTIDNGAHNYTITELTGTINQTAWDSAANGPITIRFYAKDKAGNIGTSFVIVAKISSQPTIPLGIPSFDLIALIGVSLIITLILVRKKLKK